MLKVLKKFCMINCKPSSIPFGNHFILSKEKSHANEKEMAYMSNIPYLNVIGSMMYLIACTRPDLT